MEFKTPYLAIFGALMTVFWVVDFWHIFKGAQLRSPLKVKSAKIDLERLTYFAAGLLAWCLLSFALSTPRRPLKVLPSNIEVNDIFFVVDVSRSMLADDLAPNRLEVAKEKLRKFAALRPTDRMGVIMFSEQVFTLLPLTVDPKLIDKILGEIQIGPLGSGTNIGDALGLAVARAQESSTKNKVIILLTDGVSNMGNLTPLQAAKMAKEFNIKVYTIGLGGARDAKIPMGRGIFGQRFQNIPGGSIDMKTLEEISKMTGGKTYRAETENSLEEILEEIQELEKTEIKSVSD